ncbi:carbohydrate-binding module family 50 protein [Daedalea quercina L-15889]|uniref:Carbohydrate-binding module family 50 protein n=1 Tax=Daedalea quercina L-15889 TaxID=1314783 RepID=A0A165KHG5_9APHY|nr:carbohydrate-binding module family 50 protein [Daedalea quercina L-15889]
MFLQSAVVVAAVASSAAAIRLYPVSRTILAARAAPSNIATGSFTNCTSYATVESGGTCSSLEAAADISFSDLLRWNPELNTACTDLELGYAYCVGGGGDACPDLYTVASGDYCSLIESEYGLTAAQLQTLNPWLDSNCDLEVGEVLCVGFASSTTTVTSSATPTTSTTSTSTAPTTTTVTTITTTAVPTPTNIAGGTWTNCTTYYTVQSGDSCLAIDQTYDIAYSDFLRWNPEVSAQYCNIGAGEAYCVKGSPACNNVHTVASGDSCAGLESEYGITSTQLYAVNPWLDSNCDLEVGENLCVGQVE